MGRLARSASTAGSRRSAARGATPVCISAMRSLFLIVVESVPHPTSQAREYMPNAPDPTTLVDQIDEDLTRIEMGIRQLKIQYDRFFAGGLKREPILLRADINKLIKRYSEIPLGKYHQRFRFNALVSKYNAFCELWSKAVRRSEEGERRPVLRAHAAPREQLLAACRIREADDQAPLRALYGQFIEARLATGAADPDRLSFERFLKGIRSQTAKLRESGRCAEIELLLILQDEKVRLKARAAE
jgi:hypothetical protein